MNRNQERVGANRAGSSRWRVVLTVTILVALTSACASVPKRAPLPEALASKAGVPGGERARQWGDMEPIWADKWFAMSDEETDAFLGGIIGRDHDYLAVSGGGADGADGAGLLCGWTEAGTRPEFTLVTGISTGALIAPFAFLGPDYDHVLRTFYTSTSTKDVIKKRSIFNILTSDAAASSNRSRS